MTQKPKHQIDLTPVSVTVTEVMERYLRMERPSIERLHADLKADGHKVSVDWISRRCREGGWVAKRRAIDQANNFVLHKAEIVALRDQGESLTASIYEGLEGRLITGMVRLIDELRPEMAKDLFILAETLQLVQKMSHDRRGLDIGEGRAEQPSATNGSTLGDFTVPKAH
jgi:hypothetical protein